MVRVVLEAESPQDVSLARLPLLPKKHPRKNLVLKLFRR